MILKKILRGFIFLILSIVILIAVVQLSFTFYFNNKIKTELLSAITQQSKGEYDVQIGKLGTNLFTQSIYISEFALKPVISSNATEPKYFASASEINFVKFGVIAYLLHKELNIMGIEIVNPSGYIYRSTIRTKKNDTAPEKQFSLYELIRNSIHSIKVSDIEISNADLRIYDDYRDTIPSMVSTDNKLKITNFRVDKTVAELKRIFLADEVKLIINKFSYTTPDSLYSFHVKQLMASYTDSTLVLDSINVVPNYSKRKFAHEAGKQTDRMSISAARLEFYKMDVKLFFERNWFIANELNIDSLSVSAYRDKNTARIPERAKSVQALLKSIPIYAAIDTINLKNTHIVYEEVAEGASSPGRIFFNQVNANISGFTSDSTLFSKYSKLVVSAKGLFMNAGNVKALYSFPLNTDQMVFDCSGSLTNMKMSAINAMLEPNANVSMKEGEIDSMIFSFHANDKFATGNMKFLYHNLKLEILNKKDKKTGAFEEVLTFLVHKLLIKENNPSPKENIRLTTINNPRNPDRFIFNYTWKSIFSGLKPAIGLPEGIGKKK